MKSQTSERISERTDPTTGATTTTTYSQTLRFSKDGRTLTVKTTKRTVTRPAPAAPPQQPAGDDDDRNPTI